MNDINTASSNFHSIQYADDTNLIMIFHLVYIADK